MSKNPSAAWVQPRRLGKKPGVCNRVDTPAGDCYCAENNEKAGPGHNPADGRQGLARVRGA